MAVETADELQAAMAAATRHVEEGDRVFTEGRRGVAVQAGLLSYTVQWEDGAVEDFEQGDTRHESVETPRFGVPA